MNKQHIECRELDLDIDYPVMKKWWKEHWDTFPPQEIVSPNGVMVEIDGKQIITFGLLIVEGTSFALVGNLISDPNANKRELYISFKLGMEWFKEYSKKKNITVMYTLGNQKGLNKRYQEFGFRVAEQNMTSFIYNNEDIDVGWLTD